MDPSPSDAEISAWIDKGLDTVEHFLSASTQSIRSLGKSTIKPGNTEELVAAAEKVATTAAKGTQPNAKSISSEQATRPKDKQKGLLTKTPHQEQESVYEEVIPTESAPLIPKNTPKKPPRNKEKVMSMMSLSPPDESLDETQEAVFKRGEYLHHMAEASPDRRTQKGNCHQLGNWNPAGHRMVQPNMSPNIPIHIQGNLPVWILSRCLLLV
uniref:W protein n=1 Tax=Tioman virus TaxID=162013 RepID=A0A2U8ZT80_9MONO|nr:W protein [Tioman virus]